MTKPQNMVLEWGFGWGAAVGLSRICCLAWLKAGPLHRRKMLLTAAWRHQPWHRYLLGSGRSRSWEVLRHLQLLCPLLVAQASKAPMYRATLFFPGTELPLSREYQPHPVARIFAWKAAIWLWLIQGLGGTACGHTLACFEHLHRQKICHWKVRWM